MKTLILATYMIVANWVLAQSNFDPVVADQIRHLKQEQERLERQANGEPEPPPKFPEPPSASFHYPPGGYERAILNYESEVKARGIKLDRQTLAMIDDAHRRLSGISRADWEKQKPQNNPFDNGFFGQRTNSVSTGSGHRQERACGRSGYCAARRSKYSAI